MSFSVMERFWLCAKMVIAAIRQKTTANRRADKRMKAPWLGRTFIAGCKAYVQPVSAFRLRHQTLSLCDTPSRNRAHITAHCILTPCATVRDLLRRSLGPHVIQMFFSHPTSSSGGSKFTLPTLLIAS